LTLVRCDNTGMRRALLVVLWLTPAFSQRSFSQQSLPVDKLVEFIQSSIAQKLSDKEVASYLATVRLSSRLEERTIEDLQGQGAGPKTVAALTRLADQSAAMPAEKPKPAAPAYVEPPPPPEAEQQRILEKIRAYALSYSKSLPDFICLQVTRRLQDTQYQPGRPGSFAQADRLVEKLSYFGQQEKYEPISQNENSLYGKSWESLGGSLSRGEFGSLLKDVFEPETDTTFTWDHWGRLRGHLSYVFRYFVTRPHSKYTVDYERKQQTTPGYHGLIYIEKVSDVILRLTIEPDMPPDFPVQDIHQRVDYDHVDISGRDFLLPTVSQVESRAGRFASRNEIEFRKYQKYAADSSIRFDDTDTAAAPESGDDENTRPPAKP
jgi:YD repeat-containing protein